MVISKKIFISWSGEKAQETAEHLKDAITKCISNNSSLKLNIDVFVSTDMERVGRLPETIIQQLKTAKHAFIVATKERVPPHLTVDDLGFYFWRNFVA